MKLYYTKGSCSLAVRIIINEIGLTADFEAVDLKTKTTAAGNNFLMINPKGSVPVLALSNGDILTENAVILQYLADVAEATQLLAPVGDFNRYRTLEWVNYIATELQKSIGSLFNPAMTKEMKDKVVIPLVRSKLTYINHHLEHRHYLLGEHFSLPDAYFFVMLLWASYFAIEVNEWPHIMRYFSELNQRKSIQQSLQQESS